MPEPPQLPPLPPPTPNEVEIQEAEVETEEEEEQPVSGEDVAMGSAQGGSGEVGDGVGEGQGPVCLSEMPEPQPQVKSVKHEGSSWHQQEQQHASQQHHVPASGTPGGAVPSASIATEEHLTPLPGALLPDSGVGAASTAPGSGGSSAGTTSNADHTAFGSTTQQQLPFAFTHTHPQQQQHGTDAHKKVAAHPPHGSDLAAVQERLSSAGTFKRAASCCRASSDKSASGPPPPRASSKPHTKLQLAHPVLASGDMSEGADDKEGSNGPTEHAAAGQNGHSSGALTNSAYSARTTTSELHHKQQHNPSGVMPLVAA